MPISVADADQTTDALDAGIAFADLGVPSPLVRVLADDGKTTAFPIQADTLGDSLAGRDILGRGRTGSGKTLAFSIPLVARLGQEGGAAAAMRDFERAKHASGRGGASRERVLMPHPRALVLAPTRELVNQIDEVIRPLAQAYGIDTATVYGGVNQNRQVTQLRAGADIVVACPGRLEDLLRQRLLSLESVRITVLDEADEMADMGFLPAVTRLLEQVDAAGQRMLFSATLDHGVDQLVKRFLTDAKVHAVDSADAQVDTMTHHVFAVSQGNKHEVIRELASGTGKRILFTRTKFQAKKMAKKLVQQGIPAVDLQGNLSQNQRDRHLAAFSGGDVRVLVATDVAARGIDVSDVELVVQTDPPVDPKSFLHRSGRTARAGESGDVVTLILPEQEREARSMMRRAGIRVRTQEVVPGDAVLRELVGEHAPLVHGWMLSAPSAPKSTGRSGRRGRGRGVRGDVPATGSRRRVQGQAGGRGDDAGVRDGDGSWNERRGAGSRRDGGRRGRQGGSREGSWRSEGEAPRRRRGESRYDGGGRDSRDSYGAVSEDRGRRGRGGDVGGSSYGASRRAEGQRDENRYDQGHGGSRKAAGFRRSRTKNRAPFRRAG